MQVSLVELAPGFAPTWLADAPGVSYRSLNCTGKLSYLFAVRQLAQLLIKEKVDILHTHLFFAGFNRRFDQMAATPDRRCLDETPYKRGANAWLGSAHCCRQVDG